MVKERKHGWREIIHDYPDNPAKLEILSPNHAPIAHIPKSLIDWYQTNYSEIIKLAKKYNFKENWKVIKKGNSWVPVLSDNSKDNIYIVEGNKYYLKDSAERIIPSLIQAVQSIEEWK